MLQLTEVIVTLDGVPINGAVRDEVDGIINPRVVASGSHKVNRGCRVCIAIHDD